MDSSAPQGGISSASRGWHAYRLPSSSHFRRLGFLLILGAFVAFVLINLLCLPLSSTSYCDSASWMERKFLTSSSTNNSSKQSSCFNEGSCVTAADSAAIMSFHLEHIKFMVNLVEGTGLPPGRYFDFGNSLRRDTGKYAISTDSNLEADEDRKVFVDNLSTLCEFRHKIRLHYRLYLVDNFYQSFGPWGLSPVLKPFERAIKSLKRAAEQEALMETANTRRQEKYAIKVDNILRPSLDRFFADIRVAFSDLANGVPPIIEFFTNISSYGHLVLEGLDAEIPRVAEAYQNLPWWDSVPILDLIAESIFGIKPRRWSITKYNEFLSKDEATIRTLAEHASIFHDHFAALAHYFIWYANHPVTYHYNNTEKRVAADELAQSVVDIKTRLEHDYSGTDLSPRRVIGSHLSLPANDDPFVDHSVDEDGL
ncbi:hypothetical protein IW261DRAFT_1609251 [Armillaria novae-zelandiae]|uniref:Uncharacterized protein n=1 Tax=Armillaria novae-zelandiae TaxID=153914 RepID=A0AA39P4F2_9AGAR|nr:hypothetical protein IW261DRAFT_1609251 [Armillaria novae-zelandiae]